MVKKGKLHSTSFDMNQLSDAIHPVSFYTSFVLYGGCIWMMSLILSGFASMSFVETK
jgi:hypothetical protein